MKYNPLFHGIIDELHGESRNFLLIPLGILPLQYFISKTCQGTGEFFDNQGWERN